VTSTMERETLGAGSGGGGADGPLLGVTTTLPLDIDRVSVCETGTGCRGRDTIGLMLTRGNCAWATCPLATPSLKIIWVPGVIGVLTGGNEV